MNRNAALTVGLIGGAIIGAVITYFVFRAKPLADPGPAKYVVTFGDTNPNGSQLVTADLSALRTALANPTATPNWSTLQEVPSEGATPTPVPTPPGIQPPGNPLLISRIQIVQQSMHWL